MPDHTLLTWGSKITVRQVKDWIANSDRAALGCFLEDRFTERYFVPLKGKPVSGFLLMGVSCLVIEALESYRQGWQSTERMGSAPFVDFFKHTTALNEFSPVGGPFYKNVRCGILHQGETTGGWTITQENTEPLLHRDNKRVNAAKFHSALEQVLNDYVGELKAKPITDEVWINCIYKLQATIRKCD